MLYHNIPLELRALNQWVCWRYEIVGGRQTKVPYSPDGQYKANINNPASWGAFDTACATAMSATMDGIGFVLTQNDPYTGIDIDDKLENPATPEERVAHQRILEQFQSYTERSVGGRGYHIIIRGKIPGGRDRGHVGVYSTQRYLTFSGDVVRNAPIAEYQELLEKLIDQMPGDQYAPELWEEDAILSDREVFEMAMGAANGEKYDALCRGDILYRKDGHADSPYQSQSEADLALLSMLAFYSRDNEQVRRMFRMTALGKREKAVVNNVYLDKTLKLIRAKQATPDDFKDAKALADRLVAAANAPALVDDTTFATTEQAHDYAQQALAVAPPPPPMLPALVAPPPPPAPVRAQNLYPPGLVGELASYFYSTAIRPTHEAALAAAIGICAGVAGRCYNISNTGLNQYILFIARTGTGKESIESGITKLLAATQQIVPMCGDFVGPSAFASGQGLIRVLDQRQCFVSVLGEFGLQLQALSDPRAPSATLILRKVMLDLYGKSGWQAVLRSTAYSDSEKNTKMIHAPAVTLLGECTPESFYDQLDGSDIADGLIPRFHIIEYTGQRPDENEHAGHMPSAELTRAFAGLASIAVTSANNHTCAAVQIAPDALALLKAFNRECDAHIRGAHNSGEEQLWNRAHLKSLKLSGLIAVGCNPHAPVVTADVAQWAIDFTRKGTEGIMRRFNMGDIGIGELKQQSEIKRVVREYFAHDAKQLATYKCKPEHQQAGVVPYAYLTVRLSRVACFYKDRRGAASALKAALENMVQTEMLGQVTPMDAQNKFASRQALYYVGANL